MLYAVLWFAAWVCLASYVAQGKAEGKSDDDSKSDDKNNKQTRADSSSSKGGCDNWKYGNAAKCKLSTATTIFGVVILYVWSPQSGVILIAKRANSNLAQPSFCPDGIHVLP